MKAFLFLIILLNCVTAFAEGKKVAVVKILRGDVDVLTLGKTNRLKVDDWVEDGATVKTSEKSFVKLIFIDKSQMNVGPNSEMKIEKFADNDAGVIDLVKGKIRSQVTKDYLQMKDKDKSKLFIKTPNAVMGIRGTDFMISTNGKNTAAILFEGSVVFNKIESSGVSSTSRLEEMVNQGVRMAPGEFSVVEQNRMQPTIPSRLNIQQREKLEKNDSFDSRNPSSGNEEAKKSVVPNGLSGQVVSNDAGALKTEVAQVAGGAADKTAGSATEAAGYVKGDAVKPANGSFVHIESGIIIPPGSDSTYDANSNTYIAGPESGKAAENGDFVPRAGMEITTGGEILVTTVGANGKTEIITAAAPTPVVTETPKTEPSVDTGARLGATPAPKSDVFNPGGSVINPNLKPPTGGVPDVNQAVQQFNDAGPRTRTIRTNN